MCSESMSHGVAASFLFFCLRAGWILSRYHRPKIILHQNYSKLMLDGFSQSQLPQNNLISMEFPLGRLVTWCRIDRGISIQLLSRLRESETGRSRSPNGSMTTLQSSVARREGAGKSHGSAGC